MRQSETQTLKTNICIIFQAYEQWFNHGKSQIIIVSIWKIEDNIWNIVLLCREIHPRIININMYITPLGTPQEPEDGIVSSGSSNTYSSHRTPLACG